MTRLEFQVDWVPPEGVRSDELAATWAHLVIRLGDTVLTRVLDRRAQTVRDGVYVPTYPLAEWITTNWWPLLHEVENPDKASDPDFLWRHSLAFAREGYAYPDVEIITSETQALLVWTPERLKWAEVEFLGSRGQAWIRKPELQESLTDFVDRVIRRLVSLGIEGTLLQEEWAAIRQADAEESEFCATAGALGWDPYALDDPSRALVLQIQDSLSDAVREEAVSILDPDRFDQDLAAIVAALETGRTAELPLRRLQDVRDRVLSTGRVRSQGTPWDAGFALARQTRVELGLDGQALPSLSELGLALGEDPAAVEEVTRPRDLGSARLVDGVVTMSDAGVPGFALRSRNDEARRFHFCRGLAAVMLSPSTDTLLTRAGSDRQRLSRAFAAEFLAPSTGLAKRVSKSVVDADDLSQIAEEFGVSPIVVFHQLQNHGIARVREGLRGDSP
jgi:hypothetical protein